MVYVFLADGFEEIEALATVDILRRCGLTVKTVSITGEERVTGAHGIAVEADIPADGADLSALSAAVLPGGMPGADNLQNSLLVRAALAHAQNGGKVIAAICAAPKVLGHLGILKGKKATCFPGFENELEGAEFTKERVAVDGNIITSRGAGTAHDFAFAIAAALGKGEDAKAVRASMLYDL